MSGLDVEGLEGLIKALQDAPELARRIAKRAMSDSLNVLRGLVRPYPPQPPRNRAASFNTYVRGVGHFPRSSFTAGERKKRGAYRPGPKGGRVHRTSERLGEKWTQEVRVEGDAVEGVLGNTASYVFAVQSRDRQPPYHAMTGWVTIEDALDQAEPDIVRIWGGAVDELVEELANA